MAFSLLMPLPNKAEAMTIRGILGVLLLTIMAPFVWGQLRLGFNTGLNYNMPAYKMSSQDTLTNTNEYRGVGMNVGVYSYLNLAGRKQTFGVQAELLVSTRNHTTYSQATEEINNEVFYFRESHALHNMVYVDLPVHLRINKIFKKGRFGDANLLGMFAGLQASYLMYAKYDVDHTQLLSVSGQETISRETTNRPTFAYNPFELGVSAGLMYEWQFGVRVGVRYYRSFVNLADHDRLKIKHQMILATVGYNLAKFGGR